MGSNATAAAGPQFWLLAVALVLVAVVVLFVPVWRRRAGDGSQRAAFDAGLGLALAVLLPLVALPLYLVNGQWRAQAPDQSSTAVAAVAQLEARVLAQPADGDAWWSLARVHLGQGNHDRALAAFEQAAARLGTSNQDLQVEWAEAMLMSDPSRLATAAADKLDLALVASPRNLKALWIRGQLAFAVGDFPLAIDRWESMLAIARADPAPQAREAVSVVEKAIAAARAHLGGSLADTPTDTGTGTEVAAGAVEVRVTIGAELRDLAAGLDATTPLFVLARTPDKPGPPLAVVRRQLGELPLIVELSDNDAMLPGRTISSATSVEIVARISRAGQPMAQPGDLFGAQIYNAAEGLPVEILIDRVESSPGTE